MKHCPVKLESNLAPQGRKIADARHLRVYARRLGQCEECNRLWQACAAATINQFQLQGKLRVAALERRRVADLTAEIAVAEVALVEARAAMQRHEKTHAQAATV